MWWCRPCVSRAVHDSKARQARLVVLVECTLLPRQIDTCVIVDMPL